jgi:hypothetical protein
MADLMRRMMMPPYVVELTWSSEVEGPLGPHDDIELCDVVDDAEAKVKAKEAWRQAAHSTRPDGYVLYDMGESIVEDDGTEFVGRCVSIFQSPRVSS